MTEGPDLAAWRKRLALHGGGIRSFAVWHGDDGSLRVGRSGDVVTMLDDLDISSVFPSTGPRAR